LRRRGGRILAGLLMMGATGEQHAYERKRRCAAKAAYGRAGMATGCQDCGPFGSGGFGPDWESVPVPGCEPA
jgi:hypothetical protein